MKRDAPALTKSLTFRVTDDEAAAVDRLAAQQDRKIADMIRQIFRRGLKAIGRVK